MLIIFFRKIYPPYHGGMGVYFQSNNSDDDLEELNEFAKDFEELKQNQNRKFTF